MHNSIYTFRKDIARIKKLGANTDIYANTFSYIIDMGTDSFSNFYIMITDKEQKQLELLGTRSFIARIVSIFLYKGQGYLRYRI